MIPPAVFSEPGAGGKDMPAIVQALAVGKVLRALEASLGVRLLERSTTGLALTGPGERFYARALVVLEEWEGEEGVVAGKREG